MTAARSRKLPGEGDGRPPLVDAVILLNRRLERMTVQLAEVARSLSPDRGPGDMSDVVERLDRTLVPYIALEESTLADGAGLDPMLHLEHVVIERALERVRREAARQPVDVEASRAALTRLAVALADHLRHERSVYIPHVH